MRRSSSWFPVLFNSSSESLLMRLANFLLLTSIIALACTGGRFHLSQDTFAFSHSHSLIPQETYPSKTDIINPEWEEIWHVDSENHPDYLLADPQKMAVHNGSLYIGDFQGERPVWVFGAADGDFQRHVGRLGTGPGEIQRLGSVDIIKDRYLAVRDVENQLMSLFYPDTGEFLHRLDQRIPGFPGIDGDMLLQRSFDQPNVLAVVHRLVTDEDNRVAVGDLLWEAPLDDFGEAFAPFRENTIAKQGQTVIDENAIYLSFRHASHIIALSESGEILFNTSEPHNVDPPDFVGREYGVEMMAPPVDIYPLMTLNIDTDDQYVYALHSGSIVDEENDMVDVVTSTRLDVYDKTTGAYEFAVSLPAPTRNFKVTDDRVYLITLDEEPGIVALEKPDVLL